MVFQQQALVGLDVAGAVGQAQPQPQPLIRAGIRGFARRRRAALGLPDPRAHGREPGIDAGEAGA